MKNWRIWSFVGLIVLDVAALVVAPVAPVVTGLLCISIGALFAALVTEFSTERII